MPSLLAAPALSSSTARTLLRDEMGSLDCGIVFAAMREICPFASMKRISKGKKVLAIHMLTTRFCLYKNNIPASAAICVRNIRPRDFCASDSANSTTKPCLFPDFVSITISVLLNVTSCCAAADSGLRNLINCVNRCDLEVIAPVNTGYASGLACLVQDEMDLGVTLIDLGGGTTNIATFGDGELTWCTSLPIGAQHVTSDIAKGLSTPLDSAERMKRFFANAIGGSPGNREMIEVPMLGETEPSSARQVPRSLLAGIVRPRLEETFELIRDVIESSHAASLTGRRVVITGGGSQLSGIADLASQVLDKQVRLAKPLPIPGLAEAAEGPDCSAAAGMLIYAATKHNTNNNTSPDRQQPPWIAETALGKISQWLRDNF